MTLAAAPWSSRHGSRTGAGLLGSGSTVATKFASSRWTGAHMFTKTSVSGWGFAWPSLVITSAPANAWPALANFAYSLDPKVPELHIAEKRSATDIKLKLHFNPPDDFDIRVKNWCARS